MNKKQIESAFAPIAALLFQIRESDNKVVDIIDEIKKQLKALYEAGADVKTVKEYLVFWNTNTEDSKPIRSNDAINKWLRDAGWRQREAVRSDKDTVKNDKKDKKETREEAILRIKSLMAQHNIMATELA